LLIDANLNGAYLWKANLEGANLMRANMQNADTIGAVFCRTIMPDGSVNNTNCG